MLLLKYILLIYIIKCNLHPGVLRLHLGCSWTSIPSVFSPSDLTSDALFAGAAGVCAAFNGFWFRLACGEAVGVEAGVAGDCLRIGFKR